MLKSNNSLIPGLFDEAECHINKAKEILQVNFGYEHPLLVNELKPISQEIALHKKMQKISLHPPSQIWNFKKTHTPYEKHRFEPR